MICRTCNTGENGLPKGCNNKGSCGSGGCNKLNLFDWLSNMKPASVSDEFLWVEVQFKNNRKEFYHNKDRFRLNTGDLVAVEGSPGHDIGTVSLKGELVRLQMKKVGFDSEKSDSRKIIYRKARENDIQRWKDAIAKEEKFMLHCRKISLDLGLEMKVSDVESQGDGSKATFYYTSEGRVDFRELIKILARDLKVRIEMRQIGFRQEAGMLGGVGVCGRELCCSSWMRDFRSVTTSAARYQQLSINPQKLAGQCGKLKCCLNYELDAYLDALKDFPDTGVKLKTKQGEASHQKTDIFKRLIYYSSDNAPGVIIPLSVESVKKIQKMNKDGKFPEDLAGFVERKETEQDQAAEQNEFANVLEDMSLSRFDKSKKKKKKKKKRQHGNKKGPKK